jgi:hypothetical protein
LELTFVSWKHVWQLQISVFVVVYKKEEEQNGYAERLLQLTQYRHNRIKYEGHRKPFFTFKRGWTMQLNSCLNLCTPQAG